MTDFEKSLSFEQLYRAAIECARNVRWKESVQDYLRNILSRTSRLRQDLLSGEYSIMPYIRFMVYEPKKREIVSTRFRDRVFQRSICNNGVYRDITRGFIHDNCACLVGRGVDYAIHRLDCHMRRFYRKYGVNGWVLKIDLSKFFPSIPHSVAKAAMKKRIRDENFLKYICDIIDSFPDNRSPEEIAADPFGKRSVALGSQISQLIALAVLDDLDHYIKERLKIKYYVRYMDDFILIHEDKEVLRNALLTITEMVTKLGLRLNAKTCISPLRQGVVFLKYRRFFNKTGKLIVKVNHKSISKERRKLRTLKGMVDKGKMNLNDICLHFQSWSAHAARANSRGLIRQMKNYVRQIFGGHNESHYQKRERTDRAQGTD